MSTSTERSQARRLRQRQEALEAAVRLIPPDWRWYWRPVLSRLDVGTLRRVTEAMHDPGAGEPRPVRTRPSTLTGPAPVAN